MRMRCNVVMASFFMQRRDDENELSMRMPIVDYDSDQDGVSYNRKNERKPQADQGNSNQLMKSNPTIDRCHDVSFCHSLI